MNLPPLSGADAPSPAESVKEQFSANVEGVTGGAKVRGAAPASSVDVIERVVEQLHTGQIDATAAMDQLMEHALSHPGARLLSPAQRLDLENVLRQAIADDPTLQSFKGTLDSR